MAVTILTDGGRGRRRQRYGGGVVFQAVCAFTTTDLTGFVSSSFLPKYIENITICPIGSPAIGTATDTIDLPVTALAAVAATTTFNMRVPKTGTLTSITFTVHTTVATDAANIWTWGVVDKTGPVTIVNSATAANSNNSTGGAAFTADTPFSLTLAATAVAAGDILEFTITKAASAPNLVELQVDMQMTYATAQASIETVYLDESATPNSTSGAFATPTVSGAPALAIGRKGGSTPTSGLKFFIRVEGTG